MRRRTQRLAWSLFGTGVAGLASLLAHKALERSWKQVRRKDPPLNPASSAVTWPEALSWAVAAGVVAGVSQVVARRGAVVAWVRMFGSRPRQANR